MLHEKLLYLPFKDPCHGFLCKLWKGCDSPLISFSAFQEEPFFSLRMIVIGTLLSAQICPLWLVAQCFVITEFSNYHES